MLLHLAELCAMQGLRLKNFVSFYKVKFRPTRQSTRTLRDKAAQRRLL